MREREVDAAGEVPGVPFCSAAVSAAPQAATSGPSRKGKKASEARIDPLARSPVGRKRALLDATGSAYSSSVLEIDLAV